jgi:eukaryotic-like serine/threonine-protein kinase
MEFLDGETLADRLARGRLKLNQAIEYGIDIAKALSAAHRAGVIHRDIKPGNIMLTKAGATLLDFGIAKVPDLFETRTSALETAQPLTTAGTVLGTLQYMAPEQVEGRPADSLTDIFAFGAVLYEMVSGHRAFSGESYAAIAGAIVSTAPDPLIKRDATVPTTLDHLVQVCLAKDPARRWQSAADVLTELEWVQSEQAKPHTPAETQGRSSRWKTALLVFVVVALATAVVALWSGRTQPEVSVSPAGRFEILLPAGSRLLDRPAISRDGTLIAYTSLDKDGVTRMYLRPIDRLEATALSAAEGGRAPFFSPDGRSLAFFGRGGLKSLPLDGGALKSLPLDGNPAIRWASENDPGAFLGGSWGDDGRITFALFGTEGLSRVSETGGAVESLTVPAYDADEVGHLWPEVLPGGRAVVFTTTGRDQTEPYKLCIHSSDRPGHRELISAGRSARYIPSGHIVYAQANSLVAAAFDIQTLQVKGKPLPIVERVAGVRHNASAFFSVSESGTLVYAQGPEMTPQSTTVWIGADGGQTPLKNPSVVSHPMDPYPSPTGEHIAVTMDTGSRSEVGIHDIRRGTWNRLTTTAAPDFAPVWTSEPERVIFSSTGRSGAFDLFSMAPDGSTAPELLFSSSYRKFASSWSPATKLLAYVEITDSTREDIWLLDLSASPPKANDFLKTPFREGAPDFSPDGRWIAYDSDESGRQEVYVRPVGRDGRKHQISTEGGRRPRWSRDDGRQLFYINSNNDTLMAARISFSGNEPSVVGTSVRARFPYFGGVVANYGTFPDGRILMVRLEPNTVVVDRLIVVQDWPSKITTPTAR